MTRAAFGLLILAAMVGCGQPRDRASPSAPATHPPPVADAAQLVLRYACEMGPITEPRDRSCYGPTLLVYADGTVIYRDATQAWAPLGLARVYPGYRVVRLTSPGLDGLLQGAAAIIREAAADPGTPPQPNEPIGDPFYWDTFDLSDGAATIELRPGRGPLPRHGASTARLTVLARQLGSWTPADADLVTPIVPYRAERACALLQRGAEGAGAPWPWPDLDAADLGLGAGPDARVTVPIDSAHLRTLMGDRGAWRAVVAGLPDGKGAAWLDVRVLMPDEPCPPRVA
jgi:hypothetical protein